MPALSIDTSHTFFSGIRIFHQPDTGLEFPATPRSVKPQSIESVLRALNPIPLEKLVVVADKRGTLITNEADEGFPADDRATVRGFLRTKVPFFIVTGDSWTTARDAFVDKLKVSASDFYSFHIVTGFSYEFGSVANGTYFSLATMGGIPESDRFQYACEIESVIRDCFDPHFELPQREKLARGLCTKERLKVRGLVHRLTLDIQPNKVSIFWPEFTVSSLPTQYAEFLRMIIERYASLKLDSTNPPKPLLGKFFVDVCDGDKGRGLQLIRRHIPNVFAGKYVVVLGDASNDHLLLSDPFSEALGTFRLFLGEDPVTATEILGGLPEAEAYFVKGAFTAGTMRVLSHISDKVK